MKRNLGKTGFICAVFCAVFFAISGIKTDAASQPVKITSAKIVSDKTVIRAKVKRKVSSSDDSYYLVKVNGLNHKPVNILAETKKGSRLTFKLNLDDKANIISKFGIAVKDGKKLKLVSDTKYVKNPRAAASNTMEYTLPASKKGIHWGADTNLDAKHTLVNMNLNDLIGTKENGEPYVYNGKTYYFTNE